MLRSTEIECARFDKPPRLLFFFTDSTIRKQPIREKPTNEYDSIKSSRRVFYFEVDRNRNITVNETGHPVYAIRIRGTYERAKRYIAIRKGTYVVYLLVRPTEKLVKLGRK